MTGVQTCALPISIRPLDADAVAAARQRQAQLTKPAGSLGVLEDVSIQLAGLAGSCPPPMPEPAAVAIFAADHGVHAQGVTPWPQEVTGQMVANFLAGGAVVNAFAAQAGAEVVVVDVGVAADLDQVPGLLPRKIARGTADFTAGPAMSQDQAVTAMGVGIEVARDLVAAGNRCLLTGDMGIANTTASAALICAFTGRDASEVTGRGTGVDSATLTRKIDVVRRGLALVPQWRELFPNFSVEETLLAGAHAGRDRGAIPAKVVYDLFPRLEERRKQVAGSLSGGEQQMLAIGRALVTNPKVMLLDEPSAGLAVGIVRAFVNAVKRIRDSGVAILLVEQNLEIAAALADSCVVLAAGRVVWRGSAHDATTSKEIRQAYFI